VQYAMKVLDTPLKWIGAIAAVVSLVLGLNQVTRVFSELGERQRQIAELQAVAAQQLEGSDYTAAWASLDEALAAADQGSYFAKLSGRLDPARLELRAAQEDVAMAWLRDARVPDGKTFGDVVDPLMTVITRGIVGTSGVRKADLLAHLGWAYFLKSRDGAASGNPEQAYAQALEADVANPFAHANWGHWILWKRGSDAEAERHFAAAVASGRERAYVRKLQIAALRNSGSAAAENGLLRAVDEMRRNGEEIDAATRRHVFGLYYAAFNAEQDLQRVLATLPAQEHIQTIRALYFDPDFDPAMAPLRDAMLALLQEAAGLRDDSLTTWRAIVATLPPEGDARVAEQAAAAILRLSRPARSKDSG
jgi:Tfp pilus assembly protein PilF